jgi:hypothetical protein
MHALWNFYLQNIPTPIPSRPKIQFPKLFILKPQSLFTSLRTNDHVSYTQVNVLGTGVHKFPQNTGATSKFYAQIYKALLLD